MNRRSNFHFEVMFIYSTCIKVTWGLYGSNTIPGPHESNGGLYARNADWWSVLWPCCGRAVAHQDRSICILMHWEMTRYRDTEWCNLQPNALHCRNLQGILHCILVNNSTRYLNKALYLAHWWSTVPGKLVQYITWNTGAAQECDRWTIHTGQMGGFICLACLI